MSGQGLLVSSHAALDETCDTSNSVFIDSARKTYACPPARSQVRMPQGHWIARRWSTPRKAGTLLHCGRIDPSRRISKPCPDPADDGTTVVPRPACRKQEALLYFGDRQGKDENRADGIGIEDARALQWPTSIILLLPSPSCPDGLLQRFRKVSTVRCILRLAVR